MTIRRRTYATLTATLAILALMLITGPACAPAAPVSQNSAPANAEATPTPTWPAYVSPLVHAVMVKQATIAAGAVSGPANLRPQTINVNLYIDAERSNDVEQLLSDNQVSVLDKYSCGEVCILLNAEVPVSLLPALSVHPDMGFIDTIEKYYQQLDEHLNPIVAQYDAGLITEDEAVAQSYLPRWGNRILVIADFDSPANTRNAIRYLESNDVYLAPQYIGTMVFGAFVPFRLILPLSQQPDTVSVAGYGYGADLTDPEVQKELNQFKPPLPESSAVSENPPATPAPTAEGWDGLGMLPPALPLSPMQRQYPNLDSSLISAIVKYETAAPGTAGQPAHPPPLAGLYIYTDTPERVDELRQFLEHNGATNITCGKGSGADVIHSGCGAVVPVSLLRRLAEQLGVLKIEIERTKIPT